MSGLKDMLKDGWHPKGKDGAKESWRGDFKGLNQVVCLPFPYPIQSLIDSPCLRLAGWEKEKTPMILVVQNTPPNPYRRSKTPPHLAPRRKTSNTTAPPLSRIRRPRIEAVSGLHCRRSRSMVRMLNSRRRWRMNSQANRRRPCRFAPTGLVCPEPISLLRLLNASIPLRIARRQAHPDRKPRLRFLLDEIR